MALAETMRPAGSGPETPRFSIGGLDGLAGRLS